MPEAEGGVDGDAVQRGGVVARVVEEAEVVGAAAVLSEGGGEDLREEGGADVVEEGADVVGSDCERWGGVWLA